MNRLTKWGASLVLGAFAFALALTVIPDPLHAAGTVLLAAGGLAMPDLLTNETLIGLALATVPVATTRDLKTILAEAKAIQDKYVGKAMPPEEGEKFEALCKEGEELQTQLDRQSRFSKLERFGRQIPAEDNQPQADKPGEQKAERIVGYISLGSAFVQSDEFKRFLSQGMPQTGSLPFRGGKGYFGPTRFIGLTEPQLKELQAKHEGKAVPTIGADVIDPQRIGEVVRDSEMRDDFLRSVLNVQPTTSNAVEYVTVTPPAAHAAAPVAESGLKPETATALGTATAPVRTLAVWMPVTEQQLQDIPQVQGIIDTELRYELALEEDEQVAWGDGTGQNFLGIFNTPNVLAGRTVVGDTLLDQIRRAITDVRVARLNPNGIGIHPYDWEAVQLLKGTDDRYVWVVVTDDNGSRVWGLRVVETVAMEEPSAATTPERRVLVGDFIRGATLWDRQQAAVAIGYIDDQFIRNQRTLRAEERAAFGVKRPAAFRYVIAQAEVL